MPKEFDNIKAFKQAFEIANKFTWNKKELEYYDSMDLKQADDENALQTAIKKEKKEIAKNLLDILDTDIIALKTGLSIQEVEDLKD
jgi:hypothetical protein